MSDATAPGPKERAAVITVGEGGRGFVVEAGWRGPLVLTAAHCLPKLPPAHPAMHLEEKTYPDLLGRLGESASVWAECLFVDPVGDIAVLGPPDSQELSDEHDAWEELVADGGLRVGDVPAGGEHDGWLLTLAGEWTQCRLSHEGFALLISGTSVERGMSGSPVLSSAGAAVGVLSNGSGLDPRPLHNLSAGMVRRMTCDEKPPVYRGAPS